jgi:hypothetical protein
MREWMMDEQTFNVYDRDGDLVDVLWGEDDLADSGLVLGWNDEYDVLVVLDGEETE